MKLQDIGALLRGNPYPGRMILIGMDAAGTHAVIAYAIMGRSENSRNRVFTPKGGGIITEAADPAKLADPSLILYAPVRVLGDTTIVTNGDQTDTVYEALTCRTSFEDALRTRAFEPDAPNHTPRISGLLRRWDGGFSYKLSILKSDGGSPAACVRFFFDYPRPVAGEGRLIHTYQGDGTPLPSFEGEPVPVAVTGSVEEYGNLLWDSLSKENRVSLFVRSLDLATGAAEDRIFNQYQKIESGAAV